MKITIVDKFSGRDVPATMVTFFEGGRARYQAQNPGSPAPKPKRELTVLADGGSVELKINIDGFKFQTSSDARRSAAATGIRFLNTNRGGDLGWRLDGDCPVEVFSQLVQGAMLFGYRFLKYKKNGNGTPVKVVIAAGGNATAFRRELKRLEAVYSGVNIARDLANTPAADLTPAKLSAFARSVCRKHGLTFRELKGDQLVKGKFAGISAVGQGSVNPPRLFTMTYKPPKSARKKPAKPMCFVGKGITFDSGGISLKPWDGMWDMKADMGGSSAVIGIMEAVGRLKPTMEITGVVAAAENMPDGKSYRPGDILKYKNGVSVEIHSTDAEGRLVLADALIYAQQTLKQQRIVEFSTLTGACVRALGHQYIGMLTRSDKLAAAITEAGESSGESVWQLPMHPEYRKMLESHVADIKNSGGALAGASTAGIFLHEFINRGTDYAHLDIASTFLATSKDKFWSQIGASGSGVRLAVDLLERLGG